MHRFYDPNIATTLQLSEEESKHCVRVLRLTEGDEIEVVDGVGNLFLCKIAKIITVFDRSAVSNMIVAVNDNAFLAKIAGNLIIAFHIFAHTVRDLNHCRGIAIGLPHSIMNGRPSVG